MNKRSFAQYIEIYTKAFFANKDNDVALEIRSFAALPHGWDFGMGDPIKPEIVEKALELQEKGVYLSLSTEATAEVGGGITVTFIHNDDAVDIRVNPDFTYTVTHERKIGNEFEELLYKKNLDWPTALQYLDNLKNNLKALYTCKLFAGSELVDTVRRKNNSKSSHVSTITEMVSPSSTSNVSWILPEKCAVT